MFYNLSEFMTKLKEDIGIKDIPLPVDDNEMVQRFYQSALKEFSVRYPHIREFILPPEAAVDKSSIALNGGVTYRIPKDIYQDSAILQILRIDIGRSGGYQDFYVPTGAFMSPVFMLETVADIQLAAALGSMMQHSPTFRFTFPDLLTIYNGWSGGKYLVEASFVHDLSLSTIPPGAFTHLFQLAELDMEEYLYNQLKRKNRLEVGVGTIELSLDTWEGAAEKKRDLLEKWDQEGVNLDFEPITYWG